MVLRRSRLPMARIIGAVLDRNGLRPSRYYVTKDDIVVMASEVGVLDIPPEDIAAQGAAPSRAHLPGRHGEGAHRRSDEEIKRELAAAHPYREWLDEHLVDIDDLPAAPAEHPAHETVCKRQQLSATRRKTCASSLPRWRWPAKSRSGRWAPTRRWPCCRTSRGCSSTTSQQLFAQVTNPPLDAIREELVTSMGSTIGPERNLLEPEPESCQQINLKYPIISNEHVAKLRHLPPDSPFRSTTLSMLFDAERNGAGLAEGDGGALREGERGRRRRLQHPDPVGSRRRSAARAPIPSLLATAGVHHHLVREGTRTRCAPRRRVRRRTRSASLCRCCSDTARVSSIPIWPSRRSAT